jgi:biotin synthase
MRTDWTRHEVSSIYHLPLLDLLLQAQKIHREFHPANEVQMCRLLSIKTGGCPEDCAYRPQSAGLSHIMATWAAHRI